MIKVAVMTSMGTFAHTLESAMIAERTVERIMAAGVEGSVEGPSR